MKIGIVVYSNDSETVWNAFRFANFALKEGDEINVLSNTVYEIPLTR
jgi:uncharacterized protein involved in oxidation of intracellular sulfur